MALTNCTITQSSITLTKDVQIGSSAQDQVLILSPDPGFVVSASDFTVTYAGSVGDIVDGNPVLSDTATPYHASNTVAVTISLLDTFIPTADLTKVIDVDGVAIKPSDRQFNVSGNVAFSSYADTDSNQHTRVPTSAPLSYSATNSEGVESKLLTNGVTFTANSGYYFDEEPSWNLSYIQTVLVNYFENFRTTVSNRVYTNGRLTGVTMDAYFTHPQANLSGYTLTIGAKTRAIPVRKKLITSLSIPVNNLDAKGALRRATITGTAGASYIIWVTKSNGDTYDFTNNVFLASTQQKLEGILDSSGSFSVPITFPANASGDSYVVRASGNTSPSTTTTQGATTDNTPFAVTITQTIPITITATAAGSGYSFVYTNNILSLAAGSENLDSNGDPYITKALNIAVTKVDGTNVSLTRQPVFSTDFSNNDAATNGGSDFAIDGLTATGSGTATLNVAGSFYATEAGSIPVSTVLSVGGFLNIAPVASNVSISVSKGASGNATPVATDADNDSLTYSTVTTPTNGTVTGTNPFVYTHDNSNALVDSFTYKANDGIDDSNIATVNIVVGVSPGASISASGSSGVYLVPVVLGTGAGTFKVHCNAFSVPDRFEILYSNLDNVAGNTLAGMSVQADSLFVGDGMSSTNPVRQTYGPSNMDLFTYNGSSFDTTSQNSQTIVVGDNDCASTSAGARTDASPNGPSAGYGSQIGVQNKVFTSNGDTTGTSGLDHSDGNICITFDKPATTNTYLAYIRVTGVESGTVWNIYQTEFVTPLT